MQRIKPCSFSVYLLLMIIGNVISPYGLSVSEKAPFYLMMKQSIMRGNTSLGGLQTEFADWAPSPLADFWNGSEWLPLNNSPANNEFPQITGKFGGEFAFAKGLTDVSGKKIAILKYAIGGTRIYPDPSANDWSATTDELLTNAIAEINEARALANLADPVLIWGMGIADAKDETAADNYKAQADAMFDVFKAQAGVRRILLNQTHSLLPAGTYPFRATIQSEENDIISSRADVTGFPSTAWDVGPDNVHLSKAGSTLMGQDWAAHEIALL